MVVRTAPAASRMDHPYITSAACRWSKPCLMSLCWMWPVSACEMAVCPRRRRTIAANVSMMGTPAMTSGTMSVVAAATRFTPSKAMTPSKKPSMFDPQSPMNIDAGWKL